MTIVQRSRLLTRVAEEAAALLQERLEEDGVRVTCGSRVSRVDVSGSGVTVTLDSGETIACERLLVAAGRTPTVEGLGLERIGVEVGKGGIVVDEYLAAAENVWAIGDVTGISLLTHVAKYQARVAASNVAGVRRAADYRAVPAVVFTDPQVAQVGTIEGDGIVSATWEVNRTSRSSTYEWPKRKGFVTLYADPRRRVLVGAVAVGPEVASGSSRRRWPSARRCPSTCSAHHPALPHVLRGDLLRRPRPASLGRLRGQTQGQTLRP